MGGSSTGRVGFLAVREFSGGTAAALLLSVAVCVPGDFLSQVVVVVGVLDVACIVLYRGLVSSVFVYCSKRIPALLNKGILLLSAMGGVGWSTGR